MKDVPHWVYYKLKYSSLTNELNTRNIGLYQKAMDTSFVRTINVLCWEFGKINGRRLTFLDLPFITNKKLEFKLI